MPLPELPDDDNCLLQAIQYLNTYTVVNPSLFLPYGPEYHMAESDGVQPQTYAALEDPDRENRQVPH